MSASGIRGRPLSVIAYSSISPSDIAYTLPHDVSLLQFATLQWHVDVSRGNEIEFPGELRRLCRVQGMGKSSGCSVKMWGSWVREYVEIQFPTRVAGPTA